MASVRAASEAGVAPEARPRKRVGRAPGRAAIRVSAETFWWLCCENRDLRLERTAAGRLIAMTPAGTDTGGRNLKLSGRLYNWSEATGLGEAFDSSTGFTLPNGAVRAPDASWVSHARLQLIPPADRARFAHVCPDFVAELRSPSDRLKTVRRKMAEYIAQGARLGWLIDPTRGVVEVYRPGREPEVLERPATLSGEDVLPGFVLELRGILGDEPARGEG